MNKTTIVFAVSVGLAIGLPAQPAHADCAADVVAAEARLDNIPQDLPMHGKAKGMLNKAKNKAAAKKNKACEKILAKATKILDKGEKQASKEGGGACGPQIEAAEAEMAAVNQSHVKYSELVSNINEAKQFNEQKKMRDCTMMIKKTRKIITNIQK